MRVVLYADDMEPITVIDLPTMAERYLSERGMVRRRATTVKQVAESLKAFAEANR